MKQQGDHSCCRCQRWEAPQGQREQTYMAWCQVAGRRVAFDETCPAWTYALPPLTQIPMYSGTMPRRKDGD